MNSNPLLERGPPRVAEFRIMPELRRSCWYVLAVLPVFAAAVIVLPAPKPRENGVILAILALGAVALAVPLRIRLRIDDKGLLARTMFNWRRWSWAELASGRIHFRHRYTLFDPARPWWRRRLKIINYLTEANKDLVLAAIRPHYQLPPPPDVPETMKIGYGFRKSATLDRNGVQLLERGVPVQFLWSDVRAVEIYQDDVLRRDFRRLAVELPDRRWEFRFHKGSPMWSGASPEELREMFVRHIAAERVDVALDEVTAAKPPELRRQLEKALKKRRELRNILAVFAPLLLGLMIWAAIARGFVPAAAAAVQAFAFGAVLYSFERNLRRLIAEINAQLQIAEQSPANSLEVRSG